MPLPGSVRFLLTSILPQRKQPDPRFALAEADKHLDGRTVVFVGGTDGMGRVAVEMLHQMGASIVLLGRNREKAQVLLRELAQSGGPGTVQFELCDLVSMESVRQAAARVLEENPRIDVLVNCAGANFQERVVTDEGFERNWAVNYLGPFLLTSLLLERLRASAPARIVNVASASEAVGHIDFEDLQLEHGYSPMKAYARAKLALIMFTIDLARRLEESGVTVNALNPGFIKSNLLRDLRGFEGIGQTMMRLLASPAEVGADRIVRLAVSPEYGRVNGEYVYEDSVGVPNREARDASIVERVMRVSEEAVGLQPGN